MTDREMQDLSEEAHKEYLASLSEEEYEKRIAYVKANLESVLRNLPDAHRSAFYNYVHPLAEQRGVGL